ncbi:axonemal inner arm i1 intermediate chain dynein [Cyclospora cayetanensis]|uniref:Dynein axonemal intermediate chain 4 n=1 Tax=Cyclospora cayetanensis TaxID=88456 RepID=A0A1D3D3W9_9EIME|nr:axonemal inner arm i1 intermediate chain dynein [Cyclospora cayetanensis]
MHIPAVLLPDIRFDSSPCFYSELAHYATQKTAPAPTPPRSVRIELEETATQFLFVRPSTCTVPGTEEHRQICQRNKVYAELKSSRHSIPGRFKVAHTQTLNPQQKLQAVGTGSQEPISQGVEASPAAIHDALAAKPRTLDTWRRTAEEFTQEGLLAHGTLLSVDWKVCAPRDRILAATEFDGVQGPSLKSPQASVSRKLDNSLVPSQASQRVRTRDTGRMTGGIVFSSQKQPPHQDGHRGEARKNPPTLRSLPRKPHRPSLSDNDQTTSAAKGSESVSQDVSVQPTSLNSIWQTATEGPLPKSLDVAALRVERALCQKQFHRQQMAYRNFKPQRLLQDPLYGETTGSVVAELASSHRGTVDARQPRGGARVLQIYSVASQGLPLALPASVPFLLIRIHIVFPTYRLFPPSLPYAAFFSGSSVLKYARPILCLAVFLPTSIFLVQRPCGLYVPPYRKKYISAYGIIKSANLNVVASWELEDAVSLAHLASSCFVAATTCLVLQPFAAVAMSGLGEVLVEPQILSDSDDEEPSGGGNRKQLKELMDFDARLIAGGHGVRAIAYHPLHKDTLCAAYSSSPCNLNSARSGGLLDGGVCVWDLRCSPEQPVLHSATTEGPLGCQHSDTVWDLKWLYKDGNEGLLTTGGDGHVLQWSLVHSLALTIRRTQNPCNMQLAVSKEAQRNRFFHYAAGLSLEVDKVDNNTYFVSTDEGVIHKCSLAYNEQFLDTYYGHKGPVTSVRISPFSPHFLLSCSSDWTVRLWSISRNLVEAAVYKSTEEPSAVTDVRWSPYDSTAFCCTFDDGRVELWNCREQISDPVAVLYPSVGGQRIERRLTQLRYATTTTVVVVGDDQGCLTLLSVQEEEVPVYSHQEQQERLEQSFVSKSSRQAPPPS